MKRYVKPSGAETEVNDTPQAIAYVESLGWKPVEEKAKEAKASTKPRKFGR